MPALQNTSIRFFKRFPIALHSGKMYIRHLFRYGQLHSRANVSTLLSTACLRQGDMKSQRGIDLLYSSDAIYQQGGDTVVNNHHHLHSKVSSPLRHWTGVLKGNSTTWALH